MVCGEGGTSVASRKREIGLPSYDVPVEGIPSTGSDGPTFLDIVRDEEPFATRREVGEVVVQVAEGFLAAGLYTAAEGDVIIAKAKVTERELDPGRTL